MNIALGQVDSSRRSIEALIAYWQNLVGEYRLARNLNI